MINRWLGKEFDENQVGQSRNEVEIEERAMENAGSQKANKIDTYKNEDGVKNQQKKIISGIHITNEFCCGSILPSRSITNYSILL